MKKIIVSGGSGFIGRNLCKALKEKEYYVINISRDLEKSKSSLKFIDEYLLWNQLQDDCYDKFKGVFAVINLAGASIAGSRWTEKYKQIIYNSRINSTNLIVDALNKTEYVPDVLINASAVGYYGNRYDEIITESTGKGTGYLANLCYDWEQTALKANSRRLILARTGIVLDSKEGAFVKMLLPYKIFIGGELGSGRQYLPWIHISDLVNLFIFCIENDNINGPVNFTSPEPVNMKEFAKLMGKVMHRPSFFKVPELILKSVLGEQSVIVTEGQRAIPKVALRNKFKFNYCDLELTLKELIVKRKV